MPVGRKLVVAASVLATGAGAALFFRKDASPATSWQSLLDDSPFRERVERRVANDAAWANSALATRVETVSPAADYELPTVEAAAVGPRLHNDTPTFSKSFDPVGALLEPIRTLQTDDDEPADSPAGTFAGQESTLREHRISDGDTLIRLAERYLGRGDRYLEIYDCNRDVLSSPDLLPIGAVLKIPPRSAEPPQWKTSIDTGSWAPATDMVPVERQSAAMQPRGN